jgi:hypothetical protein
MKVSFDLAEAKPAMLDNIKKDFVDQQLFFGTQSKDTLHILKELGDSKIYLYILSVSEESILKKLPKRAFEQILLKLIFRTIHRFFHLETYIFPTERTGILPLFSSATKIENYVDIENFDDLDENVKNLSSIKLSIPVQDLKLTLESVYTKTSSEREKEIQLYPEVSEYLKLAEILENDILGGKVNVENSSFDQEIIYQPSENIKLEMTVSSSMVKELAPLVLCLRYFAIPNELLIIDEPEVNLHPTAQVQIIEFLAMLVQAGLKILITTHSPYIVDHLANLIKASKYEDKESIKEKFCLDRTDAFIRQEKVSVYLFEDGTTKNILHEDGRIDWGTFGEVSEYISHVFL